MATSKQPKIVALIGPTACGKTALSISLAEKYHGEIVSADSRQIYRGMDIGTAKIISNTNDTEPQSPIRYSTIPHYLIDIRNPDEDYTVSDYRRDAVAAIEHILEQKKLPFLVGGTGLYIDAVIDNLDIPSVKADPELRASIERDISENGISSVFKKLTDRDPEAAYIVDPKNPRRVVRALEVAISTGEPFTAQRKKSEPFYEALVLGLNPLAEILRERIDRRVDEMMRDGLVDETAALIKKYGRSPVAFDAIGYREIIAHLDSTLSLEDAVAAIKINTWHYAKRQMTWFKRTPGVHWIKDDDEALALVNTFRE